MSKVRKKAPTRLGSVVIKYQAEKLPNIDDLAAQCEALRVEFAVVSRQRIDALKQLSALAKQCAALEAKHAAIQVALDLADAAIANSRGRA